MKLVKFIVIALVVLGAGGFFLLSYQQDKNRRMREEAAALGAARQTAERCHDVIRTVAQSVFEAEVQVRDHVQKATNALQTVTGRSFTRRPDKRYLPTRTARPSTPTPEKKAESDAKPDPEGDMPPGMLSREQLDRMRAAAQGRQKEKAKPEAPPAPSPSSLPLPGEEKAEPAAPEPPPAAETPKEPDIAVWTRTVVFESEAVMAKAESLREMQASAATLANKVAAARDSRTAQGHASELKALHDVALGLKGEGEASMEKIQEALNNVLEAEAVHAAEQERRREARARILEEEAQRKQTQGELADVGKLHERVRAQVKNLNFKQATADIKASADVLQTPAAKKAAAVLLERYERMQELHEFLVRRINAKRYRWGWSQGSSAKDVIAANDRALQVTGTVVPWEEVGLPQMIRLLRFYVDDKELEHKERSRQQLAVAIYYVENELKEPAESLTAELRRLYPTLHEDIDRLLPF